MCKMYQHEMLDPISADLHLLFVIKVPVILVILVVYFSAAVVLYEQLKVVCWIVLGLLMYKASFNVIMLLLAVRIQLFNTGMCPCDTSITLIFMQSIHTYTEGCNISPIPY